MTLPAPDTATAPADAPRLLEVTDLVKHFPVRGGGLFRRQVGEVHAVCGVSFSLAPGRDVGPGG